MEWTQVLRQVPGRRRRCRVIDALVVVRALFQLILGWTAGEGRVVAARFVSRCQSISLNCGRRMEMQMAAFIFCCCSHARETAGSFRKLPSRRSPPCFVPASCAARRDLQRKMKRNRASPGGSVVRLLAQFLAS